MNTVYLLIKRFFNIAVKTGLGTYSRAGNAGKLTINPTLKLGRDGVIEHLETIKEKINTFLDGRMMNGLNDDELEDLRSSFK
ncbi:MAG: hypothetical protein CR986_02965 [Ignavibacteriae bacterium]|nr:MAG: hypothetical protein CR986_02965 [Ignavibacteriota bacterium]